MTAIRPKPPYGVEYEVRVEIEGLNGETHPVITGWLALEDAAARLLTHTSSYAASHDDAKSWPIFVPC